MKAVNAALKTDVLEMGSADKFKANYWSTGLLPFDILLGGGFPKGRFSLITGDYATLKTLVGLSTIAGVQQNGGVAAVVDAEHSYDEAWAKTVGVDTDSLIVERPESGELAIDTAEALIRGGVDFIMFDSIASLLPEAERSKRLSQESIQPARIAALMSVACRRLTSANKNTAVLWINQYRTNLGITFGSKEVATGGKAMGYYSSMTIAVKKIGKVTKDVKYHDGQKWADTKETVIQKYKAELVKSRLSKPFRDVVFDWDLEQAQIDMAGYLIAQGLELGLITQSGAWIVYTQSDADGVVQNEYKLQGMPKFKKAIAESPEALAALTAAVSSHHGLV